MRQLLGVIIPLLLVATSSTSSEAFDFGRLKAEFQDWLEHSPLVYNITTAIKNVEEKIQVKGSQLIKCYDASVGDKQVDIFHSHLFDVLHVYAHENKQKFNFEDIRRKIHDFFYSLFELINLIKECMDKPESERTMFGLTSLSGFSQEEYLSLLHPFVGSELGTMVNHDDDCSSFFHYDGEIPKSYDWRDYGKVTAIKDQLHCGSCYVFSAMASTESAYLIKHPKSSNVSFSEQAVLNCIDKWDSCSSGWQYQAWDTMMRIGVVPTSSENYIGKMKNCRKPYPHATEIEGYCFKKEPVSDLEIQKLVIQKGPVVAAIDASSSAFKHLKGPFNYDCNSHINHAVVIIGWTPKYWIIKNSWGRDWGSDGFLYLNRKVFNKCGINSITGAVWTK